MPLLYEYSETPETNFKLCVYNQHGSERGNLNHEEYFTTSAAMEVRYEELYKTSLPALDPALWERVNGDFHRFSTFSDLERKYVSVELSHADANKFAEFLNKANIYYEPSECGELIHFEVKADRVERDICDDFLFRL